MEKNNKMLLNITKGVGISFISTVIMLIIFAIVLTNTEIQENTINPVIIVITAISLLIGSTIANFKNKKRGLLNGGIIGVTYMLIIYCISSILNWDFSLNLNAILFIVIGIAFGIIGGIIGVNCNIRK